VRQLTKHDVNKLSVAKLKELLPFEVVGDGEVAFVCHDVNNVEAKPKAKHDVNTMTELPLSKHKQAEGMTAQLANYVPY